ncbi:MAG: cytochrome b [Methyloligella sp. ZOD6]
MITETFPALSRVFHWLMAAMILTMLFVGIGMVASLSDYHWLVSIHKPLGILILILAAIRLINRQINPPPPLPADLPVPIRTAAIGSHLLLYGLMFAVPLVGWAMLSAGDYPVVLYGAWVLPPIAPHSPTLFAVLRTTHTVLAMLFFAVILAHIGAALLHRLVFRDGVFQSMATLHKVKPQKEGTA